MLWSWFNNNNAGILINNHHLNIINEFLNNIKNKKKLKKKIKYIVTPS